MPDEPLLDHIYHAEAAALRGDLKMPLTQPIEPQAAASVDPKGGYKSQHTGEYRVESVISYAAAHTQVSGMRSVKEGHGYATLATSVIENLNILEILTCDRIVAQIATEHPLVGHTPEISFLGTRFENLRIAGHPIHIDLDIDLVGGKPADDKHYLHDTDFMDAVWEQCKSLHSHAGLPQPARERYTGATAIDCDRHSVEFSLVTSATGDFPGKSFGHVLHIPTFGSIYLATVKITCDDDKKSPPKTTVDLTMIEAKLGCTIHADLDIASTKTNAGKPGG